jgi:RNA polymerase sigma factor FliA
VQADPPITEGNEQELWVAYRACRSERIRERLLAFYEPLARTIAARLYGSRIDDSVAFGDYLQYGRVGLMEAVERYEPDREVPFAAYSSQRIRGSILNGIARESELAAQRRFWKERWRERVSSLRAQLAPNADRASLSDVVTITMSLAVGAIVEGVEPEQEVADHNPNNDPYAVNELRQLGSTVMQLIEKLPDNERVVIRGHYVEQLEFQILGQRLGLSKGRISQIHSRALVRLREMLEHAPKLDRKV